MENSARDTRLSSYPLNLTTSRSRLEIRQHFFSQRVVNHWNDLPLHVKDSRNPKIFKQRFDEWKIIEANNTEVWTYFEEHTSTDSSNNTTNGGSGTQTFKYQVSNK